MNDPPACPRTRSLEGGGYLTPTQKSSLTASSTKDGLWKLPDLTGLWTLFEAAHPGHAPTSFHSPLPPGRLKGEIDRGGYSDATAALGSMEHRHVRAGGGKGSEQAGSHACENRHSCGRVASA